MITSSWSWRGNVIYNTIITVIGVNYFVIISCCLLSSNIFFSKYFLLLQLASLQSKANKSNPAFHALLFDGIIISAFEDNSWTERKSN